MSFEYLTASMSISTESDVSGFLREEFQAMLNDGFTTSTTYFTPILEEVVMGSNEYSDVEVRITHVINSQTGLNMGDDWKMILFKDIEHATAPGYMYQFDDNYWLVNNSEVIKNLAAGVGVRRCNNFLRWIDSNGSYHSVPCIIDYELEENKDYQTVKSSIVAPSAFATIFVQFNEHSNLIQPNQRFLFGNAGFSVGNHNWSVFKVLGGGVNNLNNLKTADDLSVGFIRMSLMKDYINDETDDLVNGIADVYKNVYTISLDQTEITGNIGREIQLNATVKLNGLMVERDVTWSSDDDEIAFVTTGGNVVLNNIGSAVITCTIAENVLVTASANVKVGITPSIDYHIVVTPEVNYILEKEHIDYTVYLYANSVKLTNAFIFSNISPNVPFDCFILNITGNNTFTVTNLKKSLDYNLVIRAYSGSYSKDITIALRGSW
jgi:hypothetical protein